MNRHLLFLLLTFMVGCKTSLNEEKNDQLIYTEDWESLAQNNKEPDWFLDAKLGIYFHWGPYTVPAFKSEWYPRWMYIEDDSNNARGVFDFHKENFGPQEEFGYHDFIPKFTAESFNAKEWVELFQEAGARFAGPVAQHHDGFAMWNSKINPWNAVDKGPKRDIVGEIFKELKKRDIKTIATFHHARNLQRYVQDTANWGGWDSHFPYHPDYATSSVDPELRLLYGNIPVDEFHEYWLGQVREVVDGYAPDMIWFDVWLRDIPDKYKRKMVATHFNAGIKNGQEPLVAYKQTSLPRDVGTLDMEQAGLTEMSPDYWMTDITLSDKSWSYVEGQTYKPIDLLIKNMIDVWSKKGIVLLNVSPRADGIINEEQQSRLKALGSWLNSFGEAVYGTRSHSVFGYGQAEIEEGFQGEGQSATQQYSASDVRFTKSKDDKILYVFLLGKPKENAHLELKYIDDFENIKHISLLGRRESIPWNIEGELVKISTPDAEKMNDIATIFKIEYK